MQLLSYKVRLLSFPNKHLRQCQETFKPDMATGTHIDRRCPHRSSELVSTSVPTGCSLIALVYIILWSVMFSNTKAIVPHVNEVVWLLVGVDVPLGNSLNCNTGNSDI